MPRPVLAAVVIAIVGVIGFLIVKGVTTGVDSSTWTSTEIAIVGLLGVIVLAVVIIAMLSGLGRTR